MQLTTTRFGAIEVKDEDVLTFPEGLVGFERLTRYVLLPNPTGGPLMWLQSVDDGKLAFIVCQPQLFKPDYRIPLRGEDLDSIELERLEDGAVYTIMVVPVGNPRGMTANLQGPLIVNQAKKLAKQHVLTGVDYGTKYKIFPD